ncbi:hypothetical protein F5141DRAFT_1149804 [Pisolithus sp. B1]|nr:hypothetical protein F5141DRAFT_1149804 [Pisolithus sp. B1]
MELLSFSFVLVWFLCLTSSRLYARASFQPCALLCMMRFRFVSFLFRRLYIAGPYAYETASMEILVYDSVSLALIYIVTVTTRRLVSVRTLPLELVQKI